MQHSDITPVVVDGRTIYLLGTAHVSSESVDLVREAITTIQPQNVLVELDDKRFASLEDSNRWKNLDLKQVIKQKQMGSLLASLVLGSYQKRLGNELGVQPGSELHQATKSARENNLRFELIDRPIHLTLKRIWKSHSIFQKSSLIGALFGSLFEKGNVSEEDLRELKKQDTLTAMTQQMGQALPVLKRVLIDERDEYMAEKIRQSTGNPVLAVVGAGHVPGMTRILTAGEKVELAKLEEIPQTPLWERAIWWSLPLLFIGAIVWFATTRSNQDIHDALLLWVMCTSIPAFIATIIAKGHPLTCITAGVLAPIAAILRAIPGPKLSLLLASIQVWFVPPRVHELENVMDELHIVKNWWKNRLLRLFLVTTLPSLALSAGALFAIGKIASH